MSCISLIAFVTAVETVVASSTLDRRCNLVTLVLDGIGAIKLVGLLVLHHLYLLLTVFVVADLCVETVVKPQKKTRELT